MKVEVILTKDYANYKKDDKITIDSMVASTLVRKLKVAKFKTKKKITKKES